MKLPRYDKVSQQLKTFYLNDSMKFTNAEFSSLVVCLQWKGWQSWSIHLARSRRAINGKKFLGKNAQRWWEDEFALVENSIVYVFYNR